MKFNSFVKPNMFKECATGYRSISFLFIYIGVVLPKIDSRQHNCSIHSPAISSALEIIRYAVYSIVM